MGSVLDSWESANWSSSLVLIAVIIGSLVALVFSVCSIIGLWKIFNKAGWYGWCSLIPVVNVYGLFKVAYGNGWRFLLLLIPIFNLFYSIVLPFRIAKAFGKGVGYGFGLLFIPQIMYMVLGFGNAEYVGPNN